MAYLARPIAAKRGVVKKKKKVKREGTSDKNAELTHTGQRGNFILRKRIYLIDVIFIILLAK